jgi:hypothetical protein
MKNILGKLSPLAQYYFKSIASFLVIFGILNLINVEYINQLFFMVCFIWHFTLNTPGLKEKMLTNKKQRYSFLNVIIRINYYLQLFIKTEKIPFGTALVRAISPMLFIFFLKVVGGNGNILFALLGCFSFELTYQLLNRKTISTPPDDPETPPEIPNAEIFHE